MDALIDALRAAAPPRAELTRGETAERAVAPLAMDALCVGELVVFLRDPGGVGRGTGADMAISCVCGVRFVVGRSPGRPLSCRRSPASSLSPEDDNHRAS